VVYFFFSQIVLRFRLESMIFLFIPWIISYRYILSIVLFLSCYIFAKGQKEVYNFPLIVSYDPISNIQANRFVLGVVEYLFELFILY
jgi:hypothetical protein